MCRIENMQRVMSRCAANRTEGLCRPVSASQGCPGELGTLRREVTGAPCSWDQLCPDTWVPSGVPRAPRAAACSAVPVAKDSRSARERPWPQHPPADVRGAGEQRDEQQPWEAQRLSRGVWGESCLWRAAARQRVGGCMVWRVLFFFFFLRLLSGC